MLLRPELLGLLLLTVMRMLAVISVLLLLVKLRL
jgi:hypothetical protein